jgi:outer membrane protein
LKPLPRSLTFACAGLFAGFASVPVVVAADLMQVYRESLSNDAQYAIARATVEAGREKLPQGLAGLLPTLGASVNTTWNDNVYNGTVRPFNTNGYNVNLTQPLFRWQNYVQYGQAKLQVLQSEANFAQAKQDLILRVAQAYFDVLNAEERVPCISGERARKSNCESL